jgi:putative DNA primase/helicase
MHTEASQNERLGAVRGLPSPPPAGEYIHEFSDVRHPDDTRPVIAYYEHSISDHVTAAMEHAFASGVPLYARGTTLFRLVAAAGGGVQLVEANEPAMIEILSKLLLWVKPDGRAKAGFKPIHCPALVAKMALSRAGEWPFPQLRAIVSAPTMRKNGTIVSKPGFDAESGIYFYSDRVWSVIPDHPTKQQAIEAIGALEWLISTFPFVGECDRSAALAMLLTALVRPSLRTAPMFGVNATAAGTGKSLIVDLASILSTGRVASVDKHYPDDEEMRKSLGARLMEGAAFINLDNVTGVIKSDFLCQVFTQEEISTRQLGASKMMKLPTSATICATGNSLRIGGDLVRRSVLVNLDAKTERPETRTFERNALKDASNYRDRLVTGGLTALRAFVVSGAAKVSPALGSFEEWSDIVRSCLVWLGYADPLSNADRMRDNDPARERASAILSALPLGKPFASSDISKMISEAANDPVDSRRHAQLYEALEEFLERGKLSSMKFSAYLGSREGQIFNGLRAFKNGQKNRNNGVMWVVERA